MLAHLHSPLVRRAGLAVVALLLLVALFLRPALDGEPADAANVSPPLAILSQPVAAADVANGPILAAAADDPSLQDDRARRVGQVAIGSLWLIPTSDDRTCLGVEPDPSTVGPTTAVVDGRKVTNGPPPTLTYNCAPNDDVASAGLLTGLRGRLAGYAPDAVASVTATKANGSPVTVDTRQRVYAVPPGAVAVTVNGVARPFGFTTTG